MTISFKDEESKYLKLFSSEALDTKIAICPSPGLIDSLSTLGKALYVYISAGPTRTPLKGQWESISALE